MKRIFALLLTAGIPCCLFATVWQSWRYTELEQNIKAIDTAQKQLVADNKQKISGIFVLSKPERIEKIAVQNLNMRKARSEDIVRIELKSD